MSQGTAPDQPEQLLTLLRDIHLPPSPPWWETPLPVYALTVIIVLFVAFWIWVRRERARPRREALRALAELRSRLGANKGRVAAEASTLLRRLAIQRYGRIPVAGLTGERWRSFLDASGGAGAFAKVSDALLIAPYQETDDSTVANLLAATERWIRSGKQPTALEAFDLSDRKTKHEDTVAASSMMPIKFVGEKSWADIKSALAFAVDRWRKPDGQAKQALDCLKRACAQSNPKDARQALLAWGAAIWPEHPPVGLTALGARLGRSDMIAEFRRLERSLYGGDADTASTWTGEALQSMIRALDQFTSAQAKVKQGSFPSLHPACGAAGNA